MNKIRFVIILMFIFNSSFLFAQKENISFEKQNKISNYISFSAGMGLEYCNNPSLKKYIEYELPFYNNLYQNQKLTDFYTGFEFFGGAEFQLKKNFSLKADYSYFTKSYNVSLYPDYDFTYINHQPYITAFYVIPQEYSFFKIGIGAGFLYSVFTKKAYSSEISYTSTGVGLNLDAVLDFQISKSVAGYIQGYINKTFQGNLKDNNGTELKNRNNEVVDLSSLGVGIRLGVEVFIFKF
jgi:hypothetical protein